MICFWIAAIGYLLGEFQIDLNVRFRDQHYAFGVGQVVPKHAKYREESEQDKEGVTTLNSTVKPVYNDHLMGYFSPFWSSSRWPRAA